jgi:hypothetical protein
MVDQLSPQKLAELLTRHENDSREVETARRLLLDAENRLRETRAQIVNEAPSLRPMFPTTRIGGKGLHGGAASGPSKAANNVQQTLGIVRQMGGSATKITLAEYLKCGAPAAQYRLDSCWNSGYLDRIEIPGPHTVGSARQRYVLKNR